MLTRRDFGLGLGALGLAAGSPALAQSVRIMKLANTAAVNDPQQCFVTAGQHPRLNFYKSGGVDVEYVNMSSMTQALQSLRRGGRLICVGLPKDGAFELPIFETVLKGISVVGSIVGTRQDLREVFALHAAGRTEVVVETRDLDEVATSMDDVLAGTVPARIVFEFV